MVEIDEESIKAVVKALPDQVKEAMLLRGKYRWMDQDIYDALYVWSDISLGVNALLGGVNREVIFDVIKHSKLYKEHPDWWKPEILSSIPGGELITDEELNQEVKKQNQQLSGYYYQQQGIEHVKE